MRGIPEFIYEKSEWTFQWSSDFQLFLSQNNAAFAFQQWHQKQTVCSILYYCSVFKEHSHEKRKEQ